MARIILLVGLIAPLLASGQSGLQAYLTYTQFLSPTDGPYIETHLAVNAASLHWTGNASDGYNASLEVTMIFWADSSIVNFKKYELNAPSQSNNKDLAFNIIDQQRFLLPNGDYRFEIKLRDINSEAKPYQFSENLQVNFPDNNVSISDIEFLESFSKSESSNPLSKSGFDLVPYVFSFYPEQVSKLKFYAEIYNSDNAFGDGNGYLATAFLQSFEQGVEVANTIQKRRMTAKKVNVMLSEFDLSELPSGNYFAVVEVRDRDNNLINSSRQFFQRSNPNLKFDTGRLAEINTLNTFVDDIASIDSLVYYIHSLMPIATEIEKIYIETGMNSGNPDLLRKYFYSFWASRFPEDPEKAWSAYKARMHSANELYGTRIKAGFETDRGRVFLQYGPPNTISREHNDPAAYPYEIWHYYTLLNQKNKKFIFYNPDLVTNDFELIHSDALGEIYNASWQLLLYRRDTPSRNLDDTGDRSQWGSRTRTYFNNPY